MAKHEGITYSCDKCNRVCDKAALTQIVEKDLDGNVKKDEMVCSGCQVAKQIVVPAPPPPPLRPWDPWDVIRPYYVPPTTEPWPHPHRDDWYAPVTCTSSPHRTESSAGDLSRRLVQ